VTYEVRWSGDLLATIAHRFTADRSPDGDPSEYDFHGGPLQAATRRFVDFDSLPEEAGPAVRSVHVVDPVFGAIVFVGILVAPGVVEVAAVDIDDDYWPMVEDDPDE
jgi:hypothetical protein